MKKKLLIALGCSYTEGVGCYGDFNPNDPNLTENDENILTTRYHTYGWPLALTKKLGYDKLINIGIRGSSTSGQIKKLFEIYYEEPFEEYDVTIIWLLTQPSRISFYTNGRITNLMPHLPIKELEHLRNKESIATAYVDFIQDIDTDPVLEQLFHIKCMEQYCENNNYSLIIANTDLLSDSLLKYFHKSKYYLSPNPVSVLTELDNDTDFAFCGHPNELGYEKVSEIIFKLLSDNHSSLKNKTPTESVKWEWRGELLQWMLFNKNMKFKLKDFKYSN